MSARSCFGARPPSTGVECSAAQPAAYCSGESLATERDGQLVSSARGHADERTFRAPPNCRSTLVEWVIRRARHCVIDTDRPQIRPAESELCTVTEHDGGQGIEYLQVFLP